MKSTMKQIAASAILMAAAIYPMMADADRDSINYIKTTTFTSAGEARGYTDIDFYDGLGNLLQQTAVMGSPSGKNIVSIVAYDNMGRKDTKTFLPYVSDSGNPVFESAAAEKQEQYYISVFGDGASNAFTTRTYSPSVDGKITRQMRPGRIYSENGIEARVEYGAGSPFQMGIVRIECSETYYPYAPEIFMREFSPQATVLYELSVNEDMDSSYVFKDTWGKVICTRIISDGTNHDTYFVRDIRDSVVCIIQPNGADSIPESFSSRSDYAKENCFVFLYDSRGRLRERITPGKGTEMFIYDRKGRVIMSTDEEKQFMELWSRTDYDDAGRVIKQGFTKLFDFPQNVQDRIDRGLDIGNICRYNSNILQHSYYKAGGINDIPDRLKFIPEYGIAETCDVDTVRVAGFPAWTISESIPDIFNAIYEIEPEICDTTAMYYDSRGRVVQSISVRSDGSASRISYRYSFAGWLTSCLERQSNGTREDWKRTDYTYGPRGEMLSSQVTVNGTKMPAVRYIYDDLGKLSGKTVGSDCSLSETFSSDMTGKITGITLAAEDTVMSIRYGYESPVSSVAIPSFCGRISEINICHGNVATETGYTVRYDHLGRVRGAYPTTGEIPGMEKSIRYDKNGNILEIDRYGNSGLTETSRFSYSDGTLSSISMNNGTYAYSFNDNGNLTRDGINGLQISYNAYNFVDRVDNLDGNMLADYIWMADGSRYRVSSSSGHGLTYRGSFTYRTDSSGAESLESIMTDDGRIIPVFSGEEEDYIYMHYTSDALGNVLTVSDTSGNIMDQNIYSLFGKRINTPDMIEDPDNRFRFSGKEEQAFAGLPYIDFGARMYDPASSRWTSPDPLAHKYFSSSPYVFCGNNPVNIIDPDGKSWYFNSETGEFVSHIEDDNDYVYLITPEQIDKVNNGDKELQSYQTESNMLGQILISGIYGESAIKAIILYFLERATWKDESGQEKYVDYPISINLERQGPPASILKSKHKLNINTSSGYYKGYDIILLLSHEVGHLVDNSFKIFSSKLPLKRLIEIERYADEFARRHWSYSKASYFGKSRIDKHYKNPVPFL